MEENKSRKKKLPGYLNDEEFMKIIRLVRNSGHKIAFILAYHSGLRISEVVNLKQENIDIGSKKIFIKEGKGGKDRVVPLPKGIPEKLLKAIPLKCGDRALQIAFKKYVKKAGIVKDNLHFHSLRHSFAVRGMEKGIPLNQIQVLLGHENIATTSVYLKINPKDALKSYEDMW